MKRKNMTRNALVTSIISLLLCVSMLVGTTFAWFTDEVISDRNTIAAGNLDVVLEYAPMENGTFGAYAEVTNQVKVFKEGALYEPGYTEVVKFKVTNAGTLALKYNLDAIVYAETEGTSKEGAFKLSDYLYTGLIAAENYTTREAAVAYATNKLSEGFSLKADGSLLPSGAQTEEGVILNAGESNEFVLVLTMPTTVGNEANYIDNKQPQLELGIALVATQLMHESDSYGPEYDDGLTPPDKDGDILRNVDGVLYAYNEIDGSARLYSVTPEFTGDTVVVLEGIDTIGGWSFYQNPGVKNVVFSSSVRTVASQAFKESKVESVVLNEGITEIGYQAFNNATELKSFNIPSTVKVIREKAFAVTAATEVTIPAGVETMEKAFRDMPNLTTVTVEGNTYIGEFCFRNCPSLRNVYLKGDDVQIHTNTVFSNASTNNPGVNNINFYVENETVAQRVHTAMGAGTKFYIYVGGEQTVFVKNATELQKALNDATGETVISFSADITGNVTATQKPNVNITIDGNGKKFTGVMTVFGQGNQASTETLNIQNINFVAVDGADSCIVSPDRSVNNMYSYAHNVTVENCTFTDPTGGLDCAAIRHEDGGDKNWVIKGCTVDNTMHSALQVNNVIGKLTVEDCTVNSKNGMNLNSSTNIEITNCSFDVTGYAVRYGVNSGGNPGEAKACVIKDSTLKSACDGGDAVIVFRASAVDMNLTLDNTTLVGSVQMSGNTADTTITTK